MRFMLSKLLAGCNFKISLSIFNYSKFIANLSKFMVITLLIVFPKFHFFMHTKTNSPNIILLSERYLDLPVALHQISLSMECYNLICPDNSLNVNRGGLCIYHRETLPIRFLTLSHWKECLTYELKLFIKKFWYQTCIGLQVTQLISLILSCLTLADI